VNVRVLPVLFAAMLVGLTVIVPSPLEAELASVNVVCASDPEAEPVAVR
jgi:hypothetical protein